MKTIELDLKIRVGEVILKLKREVEVELVKEELNRIGDLILSSVKSK